MLKNNNVYHSITAKGIKGKKDAETIEERVRRMVHNGEPLDGDGAPILFTDKKDGVKPEHDPRADKWDIAIGGMDAISKSRTAKGISAKVYDIEGNKLEGGESPSGDGGAEGTKL